MLLRETILATGAPDNVNNYNRLLTEPLICNQPVVGSNPIASSKKTGRYKKNTKHLFPQDNYGTTTARNFLTPSKPGRLPLHGHTSQT